MKRVVIYMGGLHVSRDPAIVETLLGSCVAVCLYDPVARIGGMNHFLLPAPDRRDHSSLKYGTCANEELIQRVVCLGGEKKRLKAQVFGAASVVVMDESRFSVPRANQEFVRNFLARQGIPIVAEQLGGKRPILVQMFTGEGRVTTKIVGAVAA